MKRFIAIVIFLIVAITMMILFVKYPLFYIDEIRTSALEYDVDPFLIAAIINTESRFKPEARSPKDAQGLMQIRPSTGQWIAELLGLEYEDGDLYKPASNINFGSWYIGKLLKDYDGDLKLALVAYNAGSGNLSKWLDDKDISSDGKNLDRIPFEETKNYITRVEKNYKAYSKLYKYVFR